MNRTPWWKYTLLLVVILIGLFYAAPNLYAPDPALQVSGQNSGLELGESEIKRVRTALDQADIKVKSISLEDNRVLVRLFDRADQLSAKRYAQQALGLDRYVVALNLAPTTPDWIAALGGSPMKLGLDLSGGVHFLMEVNTEKVIETRLGSMLSALKTELRKERVRGVVRLSGDTLVGNFKDAETRNSAASIANKEFPRLIATKSESDGKFLLTLSIGEEYLAEMQSEAVEQNLVTLRNRVNELGVSEPLVQRQGRSRVVVELPGVQDTAEAKRILGKTANLEFRLRARNDAAAYDKEAFIYEGRSVDIEQDIIVTGEDVTGARTGFDENSLPQVNIDLSASGGAQMNEVTKKAVKRQMAVIFIEQKLRKSGKKILDEYGDQVDQYVEYDDERIISLATIQSALGVQFRITGLDSPEEARELALLLRAGALAAPMKFVEERTIGPSLGAENIALGVKSVIIGFAFVVVLMLVVYKLFGLAANIALAINLVLIVAAMSILGATLTLPGIAGIVLTVGMAVDANVLIFSRIREELKEGSSPQMAIANGFDRAFVAIRDANITTILAALILYGVGTGPIKGFAITLSIGIVTSVFTAIVGTRALINLLYGNRRVEKLLI